MLQRPNFEASFGLPDFTDFRTDLHIKYISLNFD